MSTKPFHVMMAGGGSGGHVFPALAVASAVTARGGTVSFVGSDRGLESRAVPDHGVPFHSLPARPLVGQGLWSRIVGLAVLLASALRAWSLVRRLAPDVVLGTGGYVSAAPVLGARLGRRPVVLLEPNASPGAANRLLSRWAAGACVGWEETASKLRCPGWWTGVPVRAEFFATPEAAGASDGGRPRVLVLGGSQGAKQLNELLPAALARMPSTIELEVLHQAGPRWVEATGEAYESADLPNVDSRVVPFIDDVAQAVADATVVVSRSGAITCAELAAAGRAAVLVPLATLAEGHQEQNAAALERSGAAFVLRRDEATPEELARHLAALLGDPERLLTMGAAAQRLAQPDAAERIEAQLREVAA